MRGPARWAGQFYSEAPVSPASQVVVTQLVEMHSWCRADSGPDRLREEDNVSEPHHQGLAGRKQLSQQDCDKAAVTVMKTVLKY